MSQSLTHRSSIHNTFYSEVVCAEPPTIITREYNGVAFQFREDGYFNMTQAAKAFGKYLDNFWRTSGTRRYCYDLSKAVGADPSDPRDLSYGLIEAKRGNGGGTWAHPKLAVFFARWLDVKFAVFCDMVIDDILSKKAAVTFTPQATTPALPQTYLESLQELVKAVAEREALAAQNAQLQATNQKLLPAAEVGQVVGARERVTLMDFVRKLPGINTMQVQKTLSALGHLRKVDGRWAVYHDAKKFFGESFDGQGYSTITVSEKGQQLVTRLYLDGEFPMLKGRTPEEVSL